MLENIGIMKNILKCDFSKLIVKPNNECFEFPGIGSK